jgi:hypothetical protein
MTAKAKPPAKKILADCEPGEIAQTPAGWLYVCGQVKNGTLVELWHPDERKRLSQMFGLMNDLAVLGVTPRRPAARQVGAGDEFDPVRGR